MICIGYAHIVTHSQVTFWGLSAMSTATSTNNRRWKVFSAQYPIQQREQKPTVPRPSTTTIHSSQNAVAAPDQSTPIHQSQTGNQVDSNDGQEQAGGSLVPWSKGGNLNSLGPQTLFEHTPFKCAACHGDSYVLGQSRSASGFFARLFNVQTRYFATVTCKRCGFTDFYERAQSGATNIVDVLIR